MKIFVYFRNVSHITQKAKYISIYQRKISEFKKYFRGTRISNIFTQE